MGTGGWASAGMAAWIGAFLPVHAESALPPPFQPDVAQIRRVDAQAEQAARFTLEHFVYGTGAGSLHYILNGVDDGSGYFWLNGTAPGSLYAWLNGTGPATRYFWENGTGPWSRYYWEHGTGPGSRFAWENGTGCMSRFGWVNGATANGAACPRPGFELFYVVTCIAGVLDIAPCDSIDRAIGQVGGDVPAQVERLRELTARQTGGR